MTGDGDGVYLGAEDNICVSNTMPELDLFNAFPWNQNHHPYFHSSCLKGLTLAANDTTSLACCRAGTG